MAKQETTTVQLTGLHWKLLWLLFKCGTWFFGFVTIFGYAVIGDDTTRMFYSIGPFTLIAWGLCFCAKAWVQYRIWLDHA